MFIKTSTMKYTNGCSGQIEQLTEKLAWADAVLIGATVNF